jgi:hypothetical protein
MDPKFLLLPVLEKHGAARFSPLEQILAAEADGAYMPLRKCQRLELHRMCDVNDQLGDDMILYRLNPEKALAWLASKVERTKRALVTLDSAREGQNNGIGTGFAAGFTIQTTSSSSAGAGNKKDDGESTKAAAAARGTFLGPYLLSIEKNLHEIWKRANGQTSGSKASSSAPISSFVSADAHRQAKQEANDYHNLLIVPFSQSR